MKSLREEYRMREIFVKNNKILFKKHPDREELSKSNSSLEHIQLDKDGLATYLSEICEGDGKFVTFSAKICGNQATYDIVIEKKDELTSSYSVPKEDVPIKGIEKTEELSSINKTVIHIKKDAFLMFTGRKLKPGDFCFEKILINEELVEMPINVKTVINGAGNLYQIITDEDGTWGYNI